MRSGSLSVDSVMTSGDMSVFPVRS
jgi:hypothetical protein